MISQKLHGANTFLRRNFGTEINLNITAKSIRSALPLRIFDILACGGFCLTNYQPELEDLFTVGEDLDCYVSEDDLLAKTEYYLSTVQQR